MEGNEHCRDVQAVQGHFFGNSSPIYMMLVRSRGQTLSHKQQPTGLLLYRDKMIEKICTKLYQTLQKLFHVHCDIN